LFVTLFAFVIPVNQVKQSLGIASISKGGINGTVTDVRIILQYAIKTIASGIIICHNHPGGNVQPSESDMKITKKIKDSGNVMDVQLLDNLIIVPEGIYYSMAEKGFYKTLIYYEILVPNSRNSVNCISKMNSRQ
jgi:DNA repair protein RadC